MASGQCRFITKTPKHYQHDIIKNYGFDEYIDWRVNGILRTQKAFLVDERGQQIVDFVGRFENLGGDFAEICNKLQINQRLPHVNRSRHAAYRDYYTDRTMHLVKEAFAADIDFFDYGF